MSWDAVLPNRLDLARLQTPIIPLPKSTARYGGARLWMKRDDQTGAAESGNKIRKLQYTVAEALAQDADVLITCGGLQSNHARTTAVVARRVGLDIELVLRGEAPKRAEGNLLLDAVLGAKLHFLDPEAYADKDNVMLARAEQLRAQGRRPFVIAEGCSMASGGWGYIEAMQEVVAAERELGVRFDAVVSAVGSGGTAAGLELGARLTGFKGQCIGVPVCDTAAFFRTRVAELAEQTTRAYNLPVTIDPADIGLLDGYIGGGYGVTHPDELAVLVQLAKDDGVLLEPVYSGKAFRGLTRELDGRFADAQNILFIHTGGIFGLSAYASDLPAPVPA